MGKEDWPGWGKTELSGVIEMLHSYNFGGGFMDEWICQNVYIYLNVIVCKLNLNVDLKKEATII